MKKIRGIIFDNLNEKNIMTKKCSTEEEAMQEATNSQKRLSKKFNCDTSRFDIIGTEIN